MKKVLLVILVMMVLIGCSSNRDVEGQANAASIFDAGDCPLEIEDGALLYRIDGGNCFYGEVFPPDLLYIEELGSYRLGEGSWLLGPGVVVTFSALATRCDYQFFDIDRESDLPRILQEETSFLDLGQGSEMISDVEYHLVTVYFPDTQLMTEGVKFEYVCEYEYGGIMGRELEIRFDENINYSG